MFKLKVTEELIQNSDTSNLVSDISYLVSYLSQFITLLAGDIISIGKLFGVGIGLNPRRYLYEGDLVELSIDGLGISAQRAVNYSVYYIRLK